MAIDSEPRPFARHKEVEGHVDSSQPHCELTYLDLHRRLHRGPLQRSCTHIAAGVHCNRPAIGVPSKRLKVCIASHQRQTYAFCACLWPVKKSGKNCVLIIAHCLVQN